MSITSTSAFYLGGFRWRFSWVSDASPDFYYVWRDGKLISKQPETQIIISTGPSESVRIEVFDDATSTPSAAYPGRLTLQWRTGTAIDYYLVEEFVSAAWVVRTRIPEVGRRYEQWKSGYLADVTSHQFRITPVGTNGNTGTVLSMTCLMVRHPDPVNAAYSYNAGDGKATLTEA